MDKMKSSGEPAGQVKTPNQNDSKKTKGKDKKGKDHHKKGLVGDIKGIFVSSSSSEASLAGLNAALVHKLYDPKDLELQEDKGRRYSHRALHYLADKLNDADLCFMTMKPRGLPTDCTIKGNYVTVCRQNAILGPKNSEIEKVRLPVLKPEKTQSDEDNLILLPGQSKFEATKLLVNRDNPEEFAEYLNTKATWDTVRPDSPDSSEEERAKKLKKEQRRLAKQKETRDAQYFSDLQHLGDDGSSSGETDKGATEEVTQEESLMVEETQEMVQEEKPENPEEEVVVENPEGENPELPASEVVENPEGEKVENPEGEETGKAVGRSAEGPGEEGGENVEGSKTSIAGSGKDENKDAAATEEGGKPPEEGDKPPEEGKVPPAEGEERPAEGDGVPADGDKPPEEGDGSPEAEKPPEEGEDVDKGGAGDDTDGMIDGTVVAEGEEGEKKKGDEEETKEEGGLEPEEPPPETEPEAEEVPENAEEEDEHNSWLGYQESDYTINEDKKGEEQEEEAEEPEKPPMNPGPMMDPRMMGGMGMGGMGMGMGVNPMMYQLMNQMMMLTAMTTMSSMVSSLRPPPPPPPPPCCYPCCGPCDPCGCDPCGYDPCGYDNCCNPYYDCGSPCMMPPMPCDYPAKRKCCKKSKCKKKKSKCHKRKTKDRKSGHSGDTRSSKRSSDRTHTHTKTNSSICSREVHPHKAPVHKEEDMSFDFLPQKNCCAEVTMIMEPEEPNPLMYSVANGAMPVICCDMPPTLMVDQPYGCC